MDFNALQDTLQGPGAAGSSNASIESKYTLLAEIGRGSYGVVWKAQRQQSTQLFAVKQISKRRAGTKGLREVMGEVETMSLLTHPNIVRLEETFQDAECLWIVMEFLPGGELQQAVKSSGLQEAVVRRVVTQLLMAVEYIHDKGIVHRDLKPANCLVTEGEEMVVKISDFGFAVLAGADQCLSTYCGTVAFMAPEILLEHNYGKPVDMWALGVLTYYMVTGDYPFTGTTTTALRRAVCKGRCNLSTPRLQLFPLLCDFLAKLFERDPNRRMTAKKALKHPWIKVGRENNAGTPMHYIAVPGVGRPDGAAGPGDGHHFLPVALHTSNNAPPDGQGRRAIAGSRWRGAVLAVVAAHRLLFLQRCSRLTKLGFGQLPVLRDFHYFVSGRFEPASKALDCSKAFARNTQALTELLPMVQSCRYLASLDLSHNNIDSLSLVQALLKVCGTHPGLQSLSLAHNPIPAVAGRGLLRLARNPSSNITEIDVTETLIPEDSVAQIRSALREKATSPVAAAASTRGGSVSFLGGCSNSFALPPPPTAAQNPQLNTRRTAGGTNGGNRSSIHRSFDDAGYHGSATATAGPATTGTEKRRALHSSRLPPLPLAAATRRIEK